MLENKKSFDNNTIIIYNRNINMFYSLKNILMADKNLNVSQIANIETGKSNPNTKDTKKKLTTLMSSVAITSALFVNSANSKDISSNSATIVADGGIDNKAKLDQINQKIDSLQISLAKIENKNDLSLEEKRERYHLKKQIRVLDKERDAIKLDIDSQIDKKLAINLEKKEHNEAVIKAKLNGIKQALNNK